MPSIEGIRLKLRKKYIRYTYRYRNNLLKEKDFTIISNNCWGGFIYQSYGLRYNTPTVGLFFMPQDYLKFIKKIKYYTNIEMKFINPINSRYCKELSENIKFGKYPIGKLDDIEIMFLHYGTEKEAYDKWNERCKRINWKKIIFKFNDQNGCTLEHIKEFDRFNVKNKICFTSKNIEHLKSCVFIKKAQKQAFVYASQEPFGKSKYIDINNLINRL